MGLIISVFFLNRANLIKKSQEGRASTVSEIDPADHESNTENYLRSPRFTVMDKVLESGGESYVLSLCIKYKSEKNIKTDRSSVTGQTRPGQSTR